MPLNRGHGDLSAGSTPEVLQGVERCKLCLNILLGFPLADNLFTIAAQEIINGFDSNPD